MRPILLSSGVDGPSSGQTTAVEARFAIVAVDFFDAFSVPILAGRKLRESDTDAAATAVVVNRAFVEQFLPGMSPLGRRVSHRVRMTAGGVGEARATRAFEIVGVVENFPANPILPGETQARVYQALAVGRT